MSQGYRPDIDGLRAFSVLAVVLFHLGLTDLFGGGFVGVDVFFVISGYLIAGQICERLATGRDSALTFLAWFYGRRMRRIIPAYLFVSTLAFVAAYYLFLPDRFEQFAWSLLASIGFSANIYFWLTSDYFDAAALTKPLLHYWSLGVEEHFYLVFPILMFAIWRFGWRVIAAVMLAMFVASLVASQIMLSVRQESAFYLIQYRAWELLAGSLLAMPFVKRPRSGAVAALACVAGLGLLAYAIVNTSETSFPGLAAVPPVLAATLLIWGGQAPNAASRLIGNPVLRYVGLLSYSLYLVHWPVIVFLRHANPEFSTIELSAISLLASFALASFSFHFIETPTRRSKSVWTTGRISTLSATALTLSAVLASVVIWTDGYSARLPQDVRNLVSFRYDYRGEYREGVCFLKPDQTYADIVQDDCLPKGKHVALLWGDSHAAHFAPGLRPKLEHLGFTFAQANASACAPIVGLGDPRRPHCKDFNGYVFDWIAANRPEVVILSAMWPTDKGTMKALDVSLERLVQLGNVKVVILGQSPVYKDAVPTILANRLLHGVPSDYSLSDISPLSWTSDLAVSKVSTGKKNIRFLSVIEAACPLKSCRISDGEPFHFDRKHFTRIGSDYFSEAIIRKLSEFVK